jgi:membrane protease subunit HflC
MKRFIMSFIILAVVAAALTTAGVFYVVDETQQVVLTQFGSLVGQPIVEAGLYFKLPWQTANYFEKRLLQWDGDANQIPTRDKRLIWVDTMARWRIVDPLKFMQSVRTEHSAQTRLDDILDASTRDVLSSHNLIEAVRNTNRIIEEGVKIDTEAGLDQTQVTFESISVGRADLARKILERASKTVPNYGIELVDVRVKRINYVAEVQKKVFERMISERKRAAEQFRSEGQGKKAEIEGQVTKEWEEIQSGAYRKAQEIKGKADAEAIKIYANAYNNDPEFYAFLKTLETYKSTINKDTTLMLTTENEFYRGIEGKGLMSQ